MSSINISDIEENLGIKIIFILALTSTFLGIYITTYDIFFRQKAGDNRVLEIITFSIDDF